MRIIPMSLYTDKLRRPQRHGAPTPHAIITWERRGDQCTPRLKVTDLNGDDASHPVAIADVMSGPPGMAALSDVATYLLDMLRGDS